ncbi:hypothetical protein LJR220_003316 [Bradyrhizobium sp. LjRoot220]|uniref:hypothetical protein n=1 Tax=Bradyrhizobium sp. LjRoot220 TaxID=3342284 RepID=UPI003ECD1D26
MTIEWWLQKVQEGGGIAAVLELAALIWMNFERKRLIGEVKEKSDKVDALAERLIVVATELKTFLFSERRA